jgi:hypothetical protein
MKTDKTSTSKICTETCPLPICNLPDLLSPKQMRMAMIELELGYKQMTDDLQMNSTNISTSVNHPVRLPKPNRKVSDYLKAKLTEKKTNG